MRNLFSVVLLAAFFVSTTAQADDLLTVDLDPTASTITITATSGLSAATISGSDTTGFYLEGFFGGTTGTFGDTLLSGNLTSAANTSDGTPDLFRGFGGDPGLNVFSYTDDLTSDFVAGTVAFTGTATWELDADIFADALSGASSGDIFFAADTDDDIPSGGGTATLIGTYVVNVVPEPTTATLIGVLGITALCRRRRV